MTHTPDTPDAHTTIVGTHNGCAWSIDTVDRVVNYDGARYQVDEATWAALWNERSSPQRIIEQVVWGGRGMPIPAVADDFARTEHPGWGTAGQSGEDWIRIPPREQVDHPAHYGGADDPYEAIKVIEAWRLGARSETSGFTLGNAVKYVARAGRKDDYLLDLEKALWYLQREVECERKRRGDDE